jgi:hypothetical protein
MPKARRKIRDAELDERGPGYDGNRPHLVAVQGLTKRERDAKEPPKRNTNHCTVCRLYHRGHIDSVQHAAAERLQSQYAAAGLDSMAGSMASLDGSRGSGNGIERLAVMRADASCDLYTALAVVGRSGRVILEKIVLEGLSLAAAANVLRCKDNAVLPALKVVLDTLASHYGMSSESEYKRLHPFHG